MPYAQFHYKPTSAQEEPDYGFQFMGNMPVSIAGVPENGRPRPEAEPPSPSVEDQPYVYAQANDFFS